MAGTIIVDRIESDASYASTINVAGQITFSNTVNFGAFAGTAPVAGFYLPTTNNLAFTTASTERMRIDPTGNVSIGSTGSSGARLRVEFPSATYGPSNPTQSWAYAGKQYVNIQMDGSVNPIFNSDPESYWANPALMIWQYRASEKMRIDSSGNVGIGTASPGYKLDVQSSASSGAPLLANFQAAGGDVQVYIQNGTVKTQITADATNSASIIGSFSNHPLSFRTSNTERMRIDSSGQVLIATTSSTIGGDGGRLLIDAGASSLALLATRTGDGNIVRWYRTNVQVGSIGVTASATSYNTSSDYRLKQNIAPMTGALAKVALLKPVTYKWKADGSNGQGFIAHELAEVCPQAVNGEKDALKEDGSIMPQGIDTSFLVATLTAAIQEQQALITSLTARITAIESK
jgi:hypothetical protein